MEEEEGEIVGQSEAEKDIQTSVEAEDIEELEIPDSSNISLLKTAAPAREVGPLTRRSLPCLSKDKHKILSNSTVQKTTDLGQSLMNKKTTRKNN